jgi:hypothetical protein
MSYYDAFDPFGWVDPMASRRGYFDPWQMPSRMPLSIEDIWGPSFRHPAIEEEAPATPSNWKSVTETYTSANDGKDRLTRRVTRIRDASGRDETVDDRWLNDKHQRSVTQGPRHHKKRIEGGGEAGANQQIEGTQPGGEAGGKTDISQSQPQQQSPGQVQLWPQMDFDSLWSRNPLVSRLFGGKPSAAAADAATYYGNELKQLGQLGLVGPAGVSEETACKLLDKCQGRVNDVAMTLMALAKLKERGFTDEAACLGALDKHGMDIDNAAAALLGGGGATTKGTSV